MSTWILLDGSFGWITGFEGFRLACVFKFKAARGTDCLGWDEIDDDMFGARSKGKLLAVCVCGSTPDEQGRIVAALEAGLVPADALGSRLLLSID